MNHDDKIFLLLKALYCSPKSLEALVDTSVKVASLKEGALPKKGLSEEERKQSENHFRSPAFLASFSDSFRAIFSTDEINKLLEIYESSVMGKLFEHFEKLSAPLYASIQSHIEEQLANG